ncbi:Stp1/IreP family PP2C-type Ser/Thr phosphatase [Anaerococcus sp. Marseille-P3625]|uniref:Stp1/IreP family PP2C-type Ser/Thr phosphatase n=1 Tax=Anaerococcus sp. Marseille-P3625 TaxID=1977277 RepID=UPI000C08A1A2|nr:Stp1/IreP family PP2C-type Ser/Thr phosphatase [Anaerococcus sp. Marseille-P3625]
MKFSTISNIGKVRETNEDSYGNVSIDNYDFFIVADGMGGHSDGELASSLTVESFTNFIKDANIKDYSSVSDLQEEAIIFANSEVVKVSKEKQEKMGTTVVCLCIDYIENKIHISHIGDSRIYLFRDDNLQQLTKDHSLVNELLNSGVLNEEEAENFSNKAAVTRAVGVSLDVRADNKSMDYHKDDLVFLVTDGLTNELSAEEIKKIIKEYDDVYDISKYLVEAAICNGGRDNVTVTTIRI